MNIVASARVCGIKRNAGNVESSLYADAGGLNDDRGFAVSAVLDGGDVGVSGILAGPMKLLRGRSAWELPFVELRLGVVEASGGSEKPPEKGVAVVG